MASGMAGYTKLFSSILASTVWDESMETRIVWITLLAMADKHGISEGSVPGIAVFARLPIEATRIALERLSGPDPDSRSKEHEGRRIEAVDGGWRLLNHAKYRAKLGADERREYNRVMQAKHRHQKSLTVNFNKHNKHKAEAEAEADTKAERKNLDHLRDRFACFWSVFPRKVGKGAALKVWVRLAPSDALTAQMIAAVHAQSHSAQWQKDGGQFIPHPTTWLTQGRWEDAVEPSNQAMSLSPKTARTLGAAAAILRGEG